MADNIAEFISVLRKIRDEIYPSVEVTYANALALRDYIAAKDITLTQLVNDFNSDYSQFQISYATMGTYLSQTASNASTSASNAAAAAASANAATLRANEIKAITAQTTTGVAGSSANVTYNQIDGKFTFTIPRGDKGEKGDSFTIGATGTTAGRTTYDGYSGGFSYLDTETSTIYFKISVASGNWSAGVPFGKGDKGDTGPEGTGITSFTFVSTTDASGIPGKPNALDTYRILLSNGNTFDYVLKNGTELDGSLYLLKSQDATLSGTITFSSQPKAPSPTSADHVATKDYVDGLRLPTGIITMWSGSTSNVPAGWYICNGSNGTPDLRDRFVVGAGLSYGVGTTGGSKNAVVVSHSHTAWTDTQGAHTHTVSKGEGYGSGTTNYTGNSSSTYAGERGTSSAGSHAHNVGIGASGEDGTNKNLPPYYALAYIMKG